MSKGVDAGLGRMCPERSEKSRVVTAGAHWEEAW